MRRRQNQGFTLIELLVVITVLGLLMAFVAPRIFGNQERANTFACRANMGQLYQMVMIYKDKHKGRWPRGSGVRFLLALTQDPSLFERTAGNVDMFFCPALSHEEGRHRARENPHEWLKVLDDATHEDSHYAGRDMERHGRNLRTSDLEPLVSDDNEGGMSNHVGGINVLFAGGAVQHFLYSDWVEKGVLAPGTLSESDDPRDWCVQVGPDSPVNDTKRFGVDLTKLKVD